MIGICLLLEDWPKDSGCILTIIILNQSALCHMQNNIPYQLLDFTGNLYPITGNISGYMLACDAVHLNCALLFKSFKRPLRHGGKGQTKSHSPQSTCLLNNKRASFNGSLNACPLNHLYLHKSGGKG